MATAKNATLKTAQHAQVTLMRAKNACVAMANTMDNANCAKKKTVLNAMMTMKLVKHALKAMAEPTI